MKLRRPVVAAILLVVLAGVSLREGISTAAQGSRKVPSYKVDPFWPKPLPSIKDADGQSHQWVTGEVGASCIDSHDHIITVNRGFLRNGLLAQEGGHSIPAPPVIMYD